MGPVERELREVGAAGCSPNCLGSPAIDILFDAVRWLNFQSPYPASSPPGNLLSCLTISSPETWSEAIEAAEALGL